jgi:hypothetical protein
LHGRENVQKKVVTPGKNIYDARQEKFFKRMTMEVVRALVALPDFKSGALG